jgi:hypothetical protein
LDLGLHGKVAVVAFGASSNSLSGNYVYGNSYSGDPGDDSSAGILIAGGGAFGASLRVRGSRGGTCPCAIRLNHLRLVRNVGRSFAINRLLSGRFYRTLCADEPI